MILVKVKHHIFAIITVLNACIQLDVAKTTNHHNHDLMVWKCSLGEDL